MCVYLCGGCVLGVFCQCAMVVCMRQVWCGCLGSRAAAAGCACACSARLSSELRCGCLCTLPLGFCGLVCTSPLPSRPTAAFRRNGARATSAERPSFRARVWDTLQHSAELPSFRARGIRSSRVGLGASRGLSAIPGIWLLVPPSVCPAQGAGSSPRPFASGAGTTRRWDSRPEPRARAATPAPPTAPGPAPLQAPRSSLGGRGATRRTAPPTHLLDRPSFC